MRCVEQCRLLKAQRAATATGFGALTLLMLPPITPPLIYEEYRYPFREPLHFIVITVMSVICLYL